MLKSTAALADQATSGVGAAIPRPVSTAIRVLTSRPPAAIGPATTRMFGPSGGA